MKTVPGRIYELTIDATPLVAGADWVVSPLAQQYPVKVIGQVVVGVVGDALRTRVQVGWTGEKMGAIEPGETLYSQELASYGFGQASATVTDVQELTPGPAQRAKGKPLYLNVLEVAGGLAILGCVVWCSRRINKQTGRKRGRR